MPDKIHYTAHATATGGRDNGHAASDDGHLKVALSMPRELGGPGGDGTNPEQLFAAGYSACYLSALKFVAGQAKVKLPDDASVTAAIAIGPIPTGFGLAAELVVSLPGIDPAVADDLVLKAHQVCPYSNATRGNIAVDISVK